MTIYRVSTILTMYRDTGVMEVDMYRGKVTIYRVSTILTIYRDTGVMEVDMYMSLIQISEHTRLMRM